MFPELPIELQTEIATYLDTPSLCFFARTSWRSLRMMQPHLMRRQQQLLRSPTIKLVASGGGFFCHTSKIIYACGNNRSGHLGLGYTNASTTFTHLPQQPPGVILQLVVSYYHTLVLTDQGLYACGSNSDGQLGLGHTNPCMTFTRLPQQPPGVILQMVTGFAHTLVLTDQGLYACGGNNAGQLGLGHTNACTTFTRLPQQPPGVILQMVAGNYHSLVLTDQGLYACGANSHGQLGLGQKLYVNSYGQLGLGHSCTTFMRLEQQPSEAIRQVVACNFHTLVLADQGLYACGANSFGQLGLGDTKLCKALTRLPQQPLGVILQVMTNSYHTLVLTNQELYACGDNRFGQLGLGGHTNTYTTLTPLPQQPPGVILQVVTSLSRTLVLTDQGLYACGDNTGRLGLRHNKACIMALTLLDQVPSELRQFQALHRQLNALIRLSQTESPFPQPERLNLSGNSLPQANKSSRTQIDDLESSPQRTKFFPLKKNPMPSLKKMHGSRLAVP